MFRSQSGPGALSINTTSANSISTSSSLPPPSGGKSLFGSASTNASQSQTPSLFGTSQPPAASSPFGNTQTLSQSSQPQVGRSLFGNQSTQPAQGNGLFGSAANTAQNTGGGLFGSQQAQQTSNLFGNPTQSQPQGGSGLFGSALGQPQNSQPNNNIFGSLSNQSRPSIFGASQAPFQNPQSTMQPPPPPSLFSATIGQHIQQQQTVPGVRISVNELRPTTRFNDLHEELQKAIEYVDSFIVNKIQWKEACEMEGEKIDNMCLQLPPDVQFCTKQLATLQEALENDAESIAFAKSLVKADVADAKLSFKVVQNLQLPQQFHQTSLWSSAMTPQNPRSSVGDEDHESGANRNLVDYFSKETGSLSKKLDIYKKNISDVEDYLQGVESNTMQQMQQIMVTNGQEGKGKSVEDQVRELAAVLRAIENGILGVAAKVGGTRESLQEAMLNSAYFVGRIPK